MPGVKMFSVFCLLSLPVMAVAEETASTAPVASPAALPVWAFSSSANYCPAGLQPSTSGDGVFCGVPNQTVSYQVATGAPASGRGAGVVCPVGQKGC